MTRPAAVHRTRLFAAPGRRRLHRSLTNVTGEALEGRVLLSAVPVWIAQGPAPLLNGQPIGMEAQGNPQAGAVQAIAPLPGDANTLYVATTSGGVWKTTDATDPEPAWTPLTDGLHSLTFGDIALSPLDPSVIYAGTGNFSNGSFGELGVANGGDAVGVYKSIDAGQSWTLLGGQELTALRVRKILPTRLTVAGQQVVLAATRSSPISEVRPAGPEGLYYSGDGGTSWHALSGASGSGLPDGAINDVVEDPLQPQTFFTAVFESSDPANDGVYRSTDGGHTWSQVNGSGSTVIPADALTSADNFKLAAVAQGSTTLLYLLTAQPSSDAPRAPGISHVFVSNDQGGSWHNIDVPDALAPDGINEDDQEGNNLALGVDPNSPGTIFITGSASPTQGFGSRSIVFRATVDTSSLTAAWELAVGDGASKTIAHSDSRDIEFDANGDLLLGDDGGIYRLVSPLAGPVVRKWVSVIGNLQPTELYSADVDSVDASAPLFVGGAQDNSMGVQPSPGNPQWLTGPGGDTITVAVDNSGPQGVIYDLGPNFGSVYRSTLSGGKLVAARLPLNGLTSADQAVTAAAIPFVLNAVDSSRFALGFNGLYESFDQGQNVVPLLLPQGVTGEFSALAYGGRSGGVANPSVLYAATTDARGGPATLYLRTGAATPLVPIGKFPSAIRAIGLDPDDWRTAYLVTSTEVFQVSAAGTPQMRITNITGNLGLALSKFKTIEVVNPTATPGAVVLLVGGLSRPNDLATGGVFVTSDPYNPAGPNWTRFSSGLPNAQVTDIRYNAQDDVLVAATFGRGVWSVANASAFLPRAALVPSQTTLAVAPNPATAGTPLTLTATVAAVNPNAGTPRGTVSFYDGPTLLGSVPLSGGAARLVVASPGLGAHAFTAAYSGGPRFVAGTSPGVAVVINPVPPRDTGPTVVSVRRLGVHPASKSLLITFSAPLDRASAEDLGDYALAVPALGRRGHRKAIALRSAVYDPGTRSVILTPAHRLSLFRPYRLTLRGTGAAPITDQAGVALDGRNDRRPGTDYTAVLLGYGTTLLSPSESLSTSIRPEPGRRRRP
jgi:hypothetical protein